MYVLPNPWMFLNPAPASADAAAGDAAGIVVTPLMPAADPAVPVAHSAPSCPQAKAGAADYLSELLDFAEPRFPRGFDVHAFMDAIEEIPFFLRRAVA